METCGYADCRRPRGHTGMHWRPEYSRPRPGCAMVRMPSDAIWTEADSIVEALLIDLQTSANTKKARTLLQRHLDGVLMDLYKASMTTTYTLYNPNEASARVVVKFTVFNAMDRTYVMDVIDGVAADEPEVLSRDDARKQWTELVSKGWKRCA